MKLEINDELFNKEEKDNTPNRYKKFMSEWTDKTKDFEFTVFPNPNYKGMVIMKNITFSSLCSHHLLPFSGLCHVAYIPNKTICGASKLIRAVEKFAHKPQLQEKLCTEITNFLMEKLSPLGVIVVIESQHDCMTIRGVRNRTAKMITSEVRGVFEKEINARQEFLELIK